MEQRPFMMQFMIEKKEGLGEDSDPLSFLSDDSEYAAVGVFDGLGGSGSTLVQSSYGDKTSAYIASRLVKITSENYIKNHIHEDNFSLDSVNFKEEILNCLQDEKAKFTSEKKSLLRSSLIREYPTTLAISVVKRDESNFIVDSYWAGDSRNYLLDESGLIQLSNDDLQIAYDPLENLKNDSPISNCVCLDRPFEIKKYTLTTQNPFIVFSATDGCFGYLKTPFHFESLLLNTLLTPEVKDFSDWKVRIIQEIEKVAGDDISFSMIGIGYNSFFALKDALRARKQVINMFIDKYEEAENRLKDAQRFVTETEGAFAETEKELWYNYKSSYMRLFKVDS